MFLFPSDTYSFRSKVIDVWNKDNVLGNNSFKYFKEEDNKYYNYLLELSIPSINFNDYVYDIDSRYNDVDYRVELLGASNIDKNLYYFAGHSGNGSASYFNDLITLVKGDIVIVKYGNNKLYYVVDYIYYIEKLGFMGVDEEINTLYLITCSLENNDTQVIVKAYLT